MNLDEIVLAAMVPVVERASVAIARAVADMAAEYVSRQIARPKKKLREPGAARVAPRPKRNVELTEWTADRRARRVPTFVIEATGLDTKKKIVARFGDDATFQRGKPLPPVKKDASRSGVAWSHDGTAARG